MTCHRVRRGARRAPVRSIYKKMQVHSVAEAVTIRAGVV
jgi:hypothetical protein